jgi:hypothetical protein
MTLYMARSLALPVAADYTPAWAHRDNNHAWNVLLAADGRGAEPAHAHAAKVYRKTYAIQRGNLAFRLPPGREAPNRWLASRSYADVTDQYGETTDLPVVLDPARAGSEKFAYLCVFNGGEWVPIHWGEVTEGTATFTKMGRHVCYLPAVHDGKTLIPAAAPRILHRDGRVEPLEGSAPAAPLALAGTSPESAGLAAGEIYLLQRWRADGEQPGWTTIREFQATADPLAVEDLPGDGLYWLVARESRRLERIFVIRAGRQEWW